LPAAKTGDPLQLNDDTSNKNEENSMPILSLEAIRENPWNVLSHELPDQCQPLLLEIAWLAADYCSKSESLLLNAIRQQMDVPAQQRYIPAEWRPGGPDAHEYHEGNVRVAEDKAREIIARCNDETLAFIDWMRVCCPPID
jgi:hypothetical protein